jgi:protein-tyrosine kinase
VSIVEKALEKHRFGSPVLRAPERTAGGPEQRNHADDGEPAVARPVRLASMDRARLREAGVLPIEADERQVAEQFRAIKRPLLRNAREQVAGDAMSRRLIMVASALPGEGKTFSCVNLALSLALEKDFEVLLVDADVRKPHITRLFGLEEAQGLLDVLGDPNLSLEAGLHSITHATEVPGLSVIPVGKPSELAAELLASARMRQAAEQLARLHPHSIALFDSSPVLLTTEARVLSSLVGQIMLVVKAGTTPRQAVTDTLNFIGGGSKIGLVLNQAPLSGAAGYFYGYAYGYEASVKR